MPTVRSCAVVTATLLLVLTSTARAQSVADFYRGKTLDLIIPSSPGGDYDIRGRMIARFLGSYIPGHPNIIPRNMPAGVGIQAANYMAKIAPRYGEGVREIFSVLPRKRREAFLDHERLHRGVGQDEHLLRDGQAPVERDQHGAEPGAGIEQR